jgi:antitoxin HicB
MVISYPATFTPVEDGAIMVQVPDVPEVLSHGYSDQEAIAMGQDALTSALDMLISSGRDIPAPSAPKRGQRMIELSPQVSAKVEIYRAMREQGWTFSRLGKAMGFDAAYARRLLDLYRSSYFAHLERALEILGKRLEIQVTNAA